jgi:hypothetical protein
MHDVDALATPFAASSMRGASSVRIRGRGRLASLASPLAALLLATGTGAAAAVEQSVNEIWPEVDVFVTLDERWRLFMFAGSARANETSSNSELTAGVHIDYFADSLPDWWLGAAAMERNWSMWFRFGYNRLATVSQDRVNENRLVMEATLRSQPMWAGLQFGNRNRIDLRDIEGEGSWRYRNRTRIERTWTPAELFGSGVATRFVPLGITALNSYVTYEFFWDSRESKWNRRTLQLGTDFALGSHRAVEIYYSRQLQDRDARSSVTALGITLTLRY